MGDGDAQDLHVSELLQAVQLVPYLVNVFVTRFQKLDELQEVLVLDVGPLLSFLFLLPVGLHRCSFFGLVQPG